MTISKSNFVRSVSMLTGATAFSQLLMLAALPVLTRIYGLQDFGILAVFTATLGIISSVSSLRYHIAIPLPKTDGLASNLLALALISVSFFAVLVTLATLLIPEKFLAGIVPAEQTGNLWILGLGVLVVGVYNTFRFWATRKKAFKRIAVTRVEQAIGGIGAQVGFGLLGYGAFGLVIGQLVSQGAGFLGLARRAIKEDRRAFTQISLSRIRKAANLYGHYPRFSTFEALANAASIQVPLLVIVVFTGSAELGILMLAMRIMQAPLSLVGAAVSQVYYSQAVDDKRSNQLSQTTGNVLAGMAKLGLGPMLFAAIVAPFVFGPIFGQEWQRAGELLAWMVPWFMLQFLSSPVSMALHVAKRQKLALGLQLFGLVFRISAVIIAGTIVINADVSKWYAVSGAIFYSVYLIVVINVVGMRFTETLGRLSSSLPYVLVWAICAVTVSYLANLYI
ncbi:MAG: oligosaccharide flippase family protein [Cyclobacteriaceae bacterium]|nr:oligosaccharide flippase family protein [Cyclobacteriaceae bacterium]